MSYRQCLLTPRIVISTSRVSSVGRGVQTDPELQSRLWTPSIRRSGKFCLFWRSVPIKRVHHLAPYYIVGGVMIHKILLDQGRVTSFDNLVNRPLGEIADGQSGGSGLMKHYSWQCQLKRRTCPQRNFVKRLSIHPSPPRRIHSKENNHVR